MSGCSSCCAACVPLTQCSPWRAGHRNTSLPPKWLPWVPIFVGCCFIGGGGAPTGGGVSLGADPPHWVGDLGLGFGAKGRILFWGNALRQPNFLGVPWVGPALGWCGWGPPRGLKNKPAPFHLKWTKPGSCNTEPKKRFLGSLAGAAGTLGPQHAPCPPALPPRQPCPTGGPGGKQEDTARFSWCGGAPFPENTRKWSI